MKRVGIGLALVVMVVGEGRAQFLGGIFSQGSTDLQRSSTQLALLTALSGSTDEGYSIFLDGLTKTESIHGAEYALHQGYFASLDAVNPAIAGMPEIGEIMSFAGSIGEGFPAALGRWRASGRLTAAESEYLGRAVEGSAHRVSVILDQLKVCVTAGASSMMDADRMRRVTVLDSTARGEYGFVLDFIDGGDRLVAERKIGLQ